MSGFTKWKDKELVVTNLLLDPLNPRIPEPDPNLSQAQLIEELVEHDKVYELARNIAENGYFPVDSLIVIEKDKEKHVIEGNRRLAALKLLLNPQAAPAAWQRRFKALSDRVSPADIKTVRVSIAPSRAAASHIIMNKHTAQQVERWSRIMQAKFFKNLIDSGLSVDDIAEQYHIQASKVTDALQMHTMYAIACTLDFQEEVAKKVLNPREFPASTLERLYKNPRVGKFLGIEFDDNKQLIGRVKPDEFKKGYAKIVRDIASGVADTRLLNSTEDMDDYLGSFKKEKPNLRKKDSFTAAKLLEAAGAKGVKIPKRKTAAKKPPAKRKQKALIPKKMVCGVDNPRINDIFDELKKLNVADFPNAVAIMLRTLLELGVEEYLNNTGKMKALLSKHRAKGKKKDWSPSFRQMIAYILDEDSDVELSPPALKALRKLFSDKQSMFNVDSLDAFVHNKYYAPTEAQLRSFWLQLEELLKNILVEPEKSDS